jgi:hypothetical protein
MTAGLEALPWRGPGPGRPEELPLPPARLPLRFAGGWRKRWRYLGAYADEVLLCAARVQVGLFAQTFWAFWDRDERRLYERTVTRRPGARGEVWTEDGDGERVEWTPQEGSRVRVEARHPKAGAVNAFLRTGEGNWAESICPNGAGGFVWTRKRADVPVEVDVHIGERRIRTVARGIEDESAGYHPRHTVWSWSAGVGTLADGRSVGWNLVEGVNDPPERSERAIWVDGRPFEPGPAAFTGLDAIAFDDGSWLEFNAEAERVASENRLVVRYSYRQPFGTFRGTLPGGLELARGLGVMEHHDAVW